ncbi:integrin alpha-M isoform X2 [Xenopus laevis]|uniref:Integrin alpha-M isoform X2 n=1 Tax=Xenopus laevis TaxID=8355 RepID=A0A8J1LSS4_XENLA|nr:integrin alpha-M isoform X2 [Xenopus laevis]
MAALLHWLLLCTVLSSADGFFVDTDQPIIFQNSDSSFGYQTVQFGQRVIVSAPLQQDAVNKTGTLYSCNPATSRCRQININGSPEDINISLGLTIAAQEGNPSQLLACGPTLQKTCGSSIYVLGRCYQLDNNLRQQQTLPASLPECTIRSLDIVFLIDGSGSIAPNDFKKMLTFVSKVIEDFEGTDTLFAIMQYSNVFTRHFDFNEFSATRDHKLLISQITQLAGTTWTATAIQKVLRELFISSSGSRVGSQKFLIVITDGEKYGDSLEYTGPIAEAERMGIVRFAIGVGNAFAGEAKRELITIASQPSDKYVYRVSDFSALSKFRKDLQDKIFAIEGVQVQTGSGFQKEMSQDGFSSVLSSDLIVLGAVGAYDWSGGASVYSKKQMKNFWINETQDQKDMKAAYLGYAVHQLSSDLIAIGAPRYQHTGSVLVYQKDRYSSDWNQRAVIRGEKIGSYFGSVLNGGFVNSQLLLLVGAPTFYTPDTPGGRVFLCPLNTKASVLQVSCPITLQGDPTQYFGHFGSALCLLPDLTGDKLIDMAVGAPYEDQNQGAIYIFPGQKGGFRRSYIQRIASSQVAKGLMLFGRSMSGNLDMTGDALPDLSIGGAGKVLVLRSRTVVGVSVSMTFNPSEIPISSYECPDADTTKIATTIKMCVTCKRKTTAGEVSAQMTYTLQLDAGRIQKRAVFDRTEHSLQKTFSLNEGHNCMTYSLRLHECVEDSLSPLRVFLNFTLTGQSVLSEDSPTSLSEQVSFQKNCGSDGQCQDDLRINASFGDLRHLVVGVSLEVNVTLSVQNYAEDSYNSRAIITQPPGLSYRRVSLIQSNRRLMTIKCSTTEGERYVVCSINNPLLRPNAMAIFVVSFHVSSLADLGNLLTITTNVTSDNGGAPNDLMKSTAQLKVLYGIYVTITSLEESTKYTNHSASERSPIEREVKHVYKVGNQGQRSLPLSIIFMVPVKLKETVVWKKPSITVSEEDLSNSTTICNNTGEITNAEEFKEQIEFRPVLNCTVMTCLRFECTINSLDIQKSINFSITGQVTKDWANQSPNQKVLLQSSAEIVYDSDRYQHILEQNQPFTSAQAQTVLEVYTEYNYLPMIIGSSVGGLVLLALITAALYKLGFFKRQYKEMMELPEGQTGGGEDVAMEAQSEQKQTQ